MDSLGAPMTVVHFDMASAPEDRSCVIFPRVLSPGMDGEGQQPEGQESQVLLLPYEKARELHAALAQYIAHQQVFDEGEYPPPSFVVRPVDGG